MSDINTRFKIALDKLLNIWMYLYDYPGFTYTMSKIINLFDDNTWEETANIINKVLIDKLCNNNIDQIINIDIEYFSPDTKVIIDLYFSIIIDDNFPIEKCIMLKAKKLWFYTRIIRLYMTWMKGLKWKDAIQFDDMIRNVNNKACLFLQGPQTLASELWYISRLDKTIFKYASDKQRENILNFMNDIIGSYEFVLEGR